MPHFSILVPAYNVADYISDCLESVISQTFTDFEVIVVDDGSTDQTAEIVQNLQSKDARIRLIRLTHNSGRHVARKTAVDSSTGTYTLFLDADDAIEPHLLELLDFVSKKHDADMIRYGLSVIPGTDQDKKWAFDYEAMFNSADGELHGDDILKASFSFDFKQWVSWNIHTTMYRSDIVKSSFKEMPAERLNKLEDAYEYLVLCSRARTLYPITELRGLQYHIGRGISGRARYSIDKFMQDQRSVHDVVLAAQRFSNTQHVPAIQTATNWLSTRAVSIIQDDFQERLAPEECESAFQSIAHTWNKETACQILCNCLESRVWWFCNMNSYPADNDPVIYWKIAFSHMMDSVSFKDVFISNKELQKQAAHIYEALSELDRRIAEKNQENSAREEAYKQAIIDENKQAIIEEYKQTTLPYRITNALLPNETRRRRIFNHLINKQNNQ